MKSAVESFGLKLGNASGVFRLMRARKRGALVLFYHGVEHEITDSDIQSLQVSFTVFRRQMEYLHRNFEVISAGQLADRFEQRHAFTGGEVHLTFDDGYVNNLEVVAPYLHSLGMPFTVFVSTRHIDAGQRFPSYYLKTAFRFTEAANADFPSLGTRFDLGTAELRKHAERTVGCELKRVEQARVREIVRDLEALLPAERWVELNERFRSEAPMSWEQVRSLTMLGATIASHCHDHAILHAQQPHKEVQAQIALSRGRIESEIGTACTQFAFPNGARGDLTQESITELRREGYRLAYTTIAGELQVDCNPYVLPRAPAPFDLDRFKRLVDASSLLEGRHHYRDWARTFS